MQAGAEPSGRLHSIPQGYSRSSLNFLDRGHEEVAGGLTAQCNFNAINPIDGGIASRRTPQDVNAGPRQEAHMREVITYFFRQLDPLQTTVLAHLHLTQAHLFHLIQSTLVRIQMVR